MSDHTISVPKATRSERVAFWIFWTLALALILTGVFLGKAEAQTAPTIKTLKPIYKSEKMSLDSLGQLTSDQFEYSYGKLETINLKLSSIEKRLIEIQKKCTR